MRLLFQWIVTALTIFMIPSLVPGVTVDGIGSALAAAAVLGILNVLVRPVLIFLTLPLTILSLGIFLLFINAFLFQFVGHLIRGFQIDSFWHAFLASLVVSVVSWVFGVGRDGDRRVVFRKVVYRPEPSRRRSELGDSSDIEMKPGNDGKWRQE